MQFSPLMRPVCAWAHICRCSQTWLPIGEGFYVHVEGKRVQLCGLNWSVRSCLSKTSGQNYMKIVAFQALGAAVCELLKVCVCVCARQSINTTLWHTPSVSNWKATFVSAVFCYLMRSGLFILFFPNPKVLNYCKHKPRRLIPYIPPFLHLLHSPLSPPPSSSSLPFFLIWAVFFLLLVVFTA